MYAMWLVTTSTIRYWHHLALWQSTVPDGEAYHTPGVQRGRESDQISFGPKGWVHSPDIARPVSVVRSPAGPLVSKYSRRQSYRLGRSSPILPIAIDLLDNRRDPHSGESHALDVVEFRYQPLPCPPAIDLVRWSALRRGREIRPGESVGDDLVNGLLPPLGSREGENPMVSQEGSCQEEECGAEGTHHNCAARDSAEPLTRQ